MKKAVKYIQIAFIVFCFDVAAIAQNSILLQDPDSTVVDTYIFKEFSFESNTNKLQAIVYGVANKGKFPTLIFLHGFPGNEKNLDIAQMVRTRGWNAIYFNYSGVWGMAGNFSFLQCVEDTKNLVQYCIKHADELHIDSNNIVFFGHSMGGWVGMKATANIKEVKKAFLVSTWNVGTFSEQIKNKLQLAIGAKLMAKSFTTINTPLNKVFEPLLENSAPYYLENDVQLLKNKKIVMIDEHHKNEKLAQKLMEQNNKNIEYEVWKTDHPFSNKRITLTNRLLKFLENNEN